MSEVKVDFLLLVNKMKLSVRNTIYDAAWKEWWQRARVIRRQKLKVKNPHLWDIGKGYLIP